MKYDLHNHTTYSDGVLSPLELVKRAKMNNVDVFALTDHDSIFGCEEAYLIGKEYNIQVLKGLELSTYHNGESIHIVCLFKNNIIPNSIIEFSKEKLESRKKRAIQMMNNISNIYGLKIDIDSLLKESVIITRANMLRNIAKCNNMTLEEARFYVSDESKAYISATKLSVKDGLDLARRADCLCILAHPCLIKCDVEEILKYGFDGIEARYPKNKPGDFERFAKLAKKYNLLISAGSDCHGDSTHADIGTSYLDEIEIKPILQKLNLEV